MKIFNSPKSILFFLLPMLLFSCSRISSEYKTSIDTAVSFIEKFKDERRRLPSREEFNIWLGREQPLGLADYAVVPIDGTLEKQGVSYNLYIWTGERMWVYNSTTKKCRLQED